MEKRLETLRTQMRERQIEGILITSIPNRTYLSRFTGTAGILLITLSKAFLVTDGRYMTQARQQSPDFQVEMHDGNEFERVAALCQQESVQILSFEEEHLTYAEYRILLHLCHETQLVPIKGFVEELRLIKDDQELQAHQRAMRIVDQVYEQMLEEIRPGNTEQEIAARIEFLMRKMGASGPSFATIVASGHRSSLPHGIASEKIIHHNEMITFDFGCFVDGYVSDLTRTFFLGKPDEKHSEIYGIVLEAQEKTLETMRPGMTGKEVDQIARDVIESYGYGDFFRHGTGHGIGLEIHEAPSLRLTSEEVLRPGMVVTVEPGIYLPNEFGVRIEDDVLITESGAIRLTKATKEFIAI
ncbi:M24 family metallopeptidase [Seinonella peptonophila]|uniref:M24 family metallopeptidase n=1 Tax=Seinonella peptonophila TaxID=112248 RepID=UPI001114C499